MSLLEEFSTGLEGKDINQLIHEAKAESEERMIGQGVAFLALFISELMMETVTASHLGEAPYPSTVFSRQREAVPAS